MCWMDKCMHCPLFLIAHIFFAEFVRCIFEPSFWGYQGVTLQTFALNGSEVKQRDLRPVHSLCLRALSAHSLLAVTQQTGEEHATPRCGGSDLRAPRLKELTIAAINTAILIFDTSIAIKTRINWPKFNLHLSVWKTVAADSCYIHV